MYKYHLDVEEWYDIAAIGLCKAANTYNNDKSEFSTYAYKCMYTTIEIEGKEYVIDMITRRKNYTEAATSHLCLKCRNGGTGEIRR